MTMFPFSILHSPFSRPLLIAVALILLLLLPACGRPAAPAPPDSPFAEAAPTASPRPADDALRMIGHIASDQQLPQMEALLARFSAQTGVAVDYKGDPLLPELLRQQLDAEQIPDLILLPVPNWIDALASAGAIVPLDEAASAAVEAHFGEGWQQLVSVDGQLFGVPFDARSKSLLYGPPSLLPADGFADLADLQRFAEVRAAQGNVTFALPGAIGWTLTDSFENTLLASAGPEVYDALRDHRIPWTDDRVVAAFDTWLALLRPGHLLDGAAGTVELPLRADVFATIFDVEPPPAALWWGPEGVIAESGVAPIGVTPFPMDGVVGVGSVVVATNARPATMALLAYLAQPDAILPWVEAGGFVSPNRDVPLDAYPDALSRAQAAQLVDASLFRYDLSDRLPPKLGGDYLWGQLKAILLAPDELPRLLAEIERVAIREQGSGLTQNAERKTQNDKRKTTSVQATLE
ncbi:MAG: carbohydrate ABC transporter substrate-binding protein [Anaerolineales bacterium]|nr:carbohydrate ABC transporter substrate-binding protein [Anaerolineales bacterium]MCB9127374.1 carbohydrate ABC transporter substrate-binding protein [Ardenticatenales bacterium]MCB9172708.1 carbohydrate ABC transporter substrate-binding protein [Ardenticatenales bacterium]